MRNYKILGQKYKSGNWYISNSNLDSLEGSPTHIDMNFACNHNNLTSLVGGPQKVDGDYNCEYNRLTDLTGCASHIGGEFGFWHNTKITSLVGIHKIIKSCTRIHFYTELIKEGGIGLLLIENLNRITANTEQFAIIQKYLGTGTKGMMKCSKELTAKGYAQYAKL